ncbi:DUF3857 domain-containing transglutaminase family protein [Arenimonas oryziterrae]|uniref:DUF3857 domain-containing protein n=1 Tax=Arenimonas oryziterrae DSM 21050 = YC6267 TaxID=1121015 RepID=A0A091AVW6_9GAMM|nr:DUF3857 domain-containing protein [Arenimonas oryziterrae]KFN43581.1 hypothetical protein N789_09915 [Arenimonas oryziterrae DSM 21050 = YC6267]
MRILLLCLGLLSSSMAGAQMVTHERGEFRFNVGPAPEFVQVRSVPDQWAAASKTPDTDERWRNWLIDEQVDRRGGGHVAYFDRAFEPLSAGMVDEAAKFSVSFSPLFQTLTLHRIEVRRDGKWSNRLDAAKVSLARRETDFEENMSDGEVTALLVLEDVRAHDVVRVVYSINGSNPIMGDNITTAFTVGWIDTILEQHGRVLFDPAAQISVQRLRTEEKVLQVRHADRLEVSFDAELTPAIRDMGDYPNWYSPYPAVLVGNKRSWSDIVQWALPLYPMDAPLPAELETRLEQWKKLPDAYQQAGAVLRAMQEEVRYFGIEMGDNTHRPNPPALIWSRRYGDCKDKAYLSAMLLRRLGIQADPALVSTRRGRAIAERLPSASAFNHVIVRVRIGKETLWLDPTLTQQRGDIRQLDLIDYGMALPIVTGATALEEVRAPDGVKNELSVVERFVPRADGKAIDLFVESHYRGERAELTRQRLRSRRLEQISDDFADYYRKQYGDLSIVTPMTVREDDKENTVVYSEHYLLEGVWGKASGGSRNLSAYADALSKDAALPDSMARTEPMRLSRPSKLRHEVRIELPAGWVLSDLPQNLVVSGELIDYRRTLSQENRVVKLVHQFDLRSDHVDTPQVGKYLTDLREIHDALNARLTLGMPAQVRSSERDQRLKDLLRNAMEPEKEEGK